MIEFLRTGGGGAAAGGAWTFIAETILGAPAASVTFAAIPQTYRVLWLFAQVRTDRATENDTLLWRANNDSGANYDRVGLYAQGGGFRAATGGVAQTAGWAGNTEAANSRANNFSRTMMDWQDYASVAIEKNSLTPSSARAGDRSATADLEEVMMASWWRSTAAITRLDFLPNTGPNFVAGSTFTLYGIT